MVLFWPVAAIALGRNLERPLTASSINQGTFMELKTSARLRAALLNERVMASIETLISEDGFLGVEVFDQLREFATAYAAASAVRAELHELLCTTFDATFGAAIRVFNQRRSDYLRYLPAENSTKPGDAVLPPKPFNSWMTHAVECQIAPPYTNTAKGRIGVHVQQTGDLVLSLSFKRDGTQPPPLKIRGWEELAGRLIFARPDINLVADTKVNIDQLRDAASTAIRRLGKKLLAEQDTDEERWIKAHLIKRTYRSSKNEDDV